MPGNSHALNGERLRSVPTRIVITLLFWLTHASLGMAAELIGVVSDLHDDTVTIDVLDVEQRIQMHDKVNVYWTTEVERIIVARGLVVAETDTSIVARMDQFPGGAPAIGMDASVVIANDHKIETTQTDHSDSPEVTRKAPVTDVIDTPLVPEPVTELYQPIAFATDSEGDEEGFTVGTVIADEIVLTTLDLDADAAPASQTAPAATSVDPNTRNTTTNTKVARVVKPERLVKTELIVAQPAVANTSVIDENATPLDAHLRICERHLSNEQQNGALQAQALSCFLLAFELSPNNKMAQEGLRRVNDVYRTLYDAEKDAGDKATIDAYRAHFRVLDDVSSLFE